jgi:hypothetical protein
MIEKIKSVAEILDSLGGKKEIAKLVGITLTSVNHWILVNRIGIKNRPKILQIAKEKNINLTMLDVTPYRKRKRVVELSKKYQEIIQDKSNDQSNQGIMT